MERRLSKMIPRRSPRLSHKLKFPKNNSTSMQDLRLAGSNKTSVNKGLRAKRVKSSDFTAIVGILQNKLKQEPKIKSFTKENKSNRKQSRALKRMRDATVTLRNLDNIMSPVKRVKSCSEKLSECGDTIENRADPLKKKLTRVVSFARGFSPRRSERRKCHEEIIQRSSSLRVPSPRSPDSSINPTFKFPVRSRIRGAQLWLESVADLDEVDCWTPQQIKRQEAIYELYCGESDLIEDIKLLQEIYYKPLSELKLITDDELSSIFGSIQSLLPLHEDFVTKLEAVREENGSIEEIAEIILKWIPTMQPYVAYCAKQLEIKEILFQISKDKQITDFFQRCLEAPCSRKLDLWSFLDSPRSKLVKYPLLVANIHQYTPKDHPDRTLLETVIKDLECLIKEADKQAGISKCTFYKDKLNMMEDEEYKKAFDEASILVCNGCLKNKGGSKVQVFLFDTIFICSRTTSRNGNKVYIVNVKPILVSDMYVTDLGDGEVRLGGSFRTTLSKGAGARHAFRVCSKSMENCKSIVLQCGDKHDKKQWLNAFQSLLGTSALQTYRNNNTLNQLLTVTSPNQNPNHLTINTPAASSQSNSTNEIPCLS